MNKAVRVGFLGAGGIAQAHAYALDALKFYYEDAPTFEKVVVASPTPSSREGFAKRFGFQQALSPDEIWRRDDLDALFILGTNQTHTPQLLKAVQSPNIRRIYVEKPIGTCQEDIENLEALDASSTEKFIMVGFQFLQKSAIRKALAHWQSGVFGTPIHFRAEYLHSSYLNPNYRKIHQDRLLPIPLQGAAVDLGSHTLSLLTAFLGNSLVVREAAASCRFPDVSQYSDLCTTALIEDQTSGAIGTWIASRVSVGTGDLLSLEIRGTKGAILYDTNRPDSYQSYLMEDGWQRHEVNSDYLPVTKLPSHYAPSGWLRALVHNHYLFFNGGDEISVIPNLAHGIRVQRLLQQIADKLLIKS